MEIFYFPLQFTKSHSNELNVFFLNKKNYLIVLKEKI